MPSNKKRIKKSGSASQATPPQGSNVVIHRSTKTTMIGIVVALGLVGWLIIGPETEDHTVSVIVPTLSETASAGEKTFNRVCVDCHGENAGGSSDGPPLIHPFYRPGHHANGAIVNAISKGVRQHHWKFGPMPTQPKVMQEEVRPLIAYIREVQRANGIN